MKKLLLAFAVLCVGSTSMAATINICGTTVDQIEVRSLEATVNQDIGSIARNAVARGDDVDICAVGSLPVAITKTLLRTGQVVKTAYIFKAN